MVKLLHHHTVTLVLEHNSCEILVKKWDTIVKQLDDSSQNHQIFIYSENLSNPDTLGTRKCPD